MKSPKTPADNNDVMWRLVLNFIYHGFAVLNSILDGYYSSELTRWVESKVGIAELRYKMPSKFKVGAIHECPYLKFQGWKYQPFLPVTTIEQNCEVKMMRK